MIVSATDVYGQPLAVPANMSIERLGSSSSRRQVAKDVPPDGHATFDVDVAHHYRVRVHAAGHGNAGAMVPGTVDDLPVVVPVDATLVVGYRWPEPLPAIHGVATDVEESQLGGVVWQLLDDVRRGTLLNIWAKMWDTTIGVMPIAGYVDRVVEVRVDRIIVELTHGVAEMLADPDVRAENNLDLVPSALHDPPPGYERGISVKTRDDHGNLQISTFEWELPEGDFIPAEPAHEYLGKPTLADIDIDENRKTFAHLFDVIRHHVTGEQTDPIEVHAILVHAGIDPGWQPLLA